VEEIVFESGMSDTVPLISEVSFQYIRPLTDLAGTFSDVVDRVTHYSRVLESYFTLDEFQIVDKNFSGNKGNVFGFNDQDIVALGIGLSDEYALQMAARTAYTKNIIHTVFAGDLIGINTERVLGDNLAVSLVSRIQAEKGLFSAVVDWTDDISAIISRGTADAISFVHERTWDLQTRLIQQVVLQSGTTTEFNTAVLDSISGFSSVVNRAIQPQCSDILGTSDYSYNVVEYTRFINSYFALDDFTYINKDFQGTKGNVFGVTETIGNAFSTGSTSTSSLEDHIPEIDLGRGAQDPVALTDIQNKYAEVAKTSEASISDTPVVLHASGYNSDFTPYDVVIRVVDWGRVLSDSASIQSTLDRISNSKGVADSTSVTESYNRGISSVVADSTSVTESYNRGISSVVADSTSVTDLVSHELIRGALFNSAPINNSTLN